MDRWVLLQTYFHKYDAEMAVGLLQESGIESLLQSDDLGGLRLHLSLGMGNNRVLVPQQDLARAREVIATLDDDLSPEELAGIEEAALVRKSTESLPPKGPNAVSGYAWLIPLIAAILFLAFYALS